MTASQTASHGAGQRGSAGDHAGTSTREQGSRAAGGAAMRGAAWALADALPVGCGGVATVPARTPDEDVARLVALGCAVVRSCWVQVAMWTTSEAGVTSRDEGCGRT